MNLVPAINEMQKEISNLELEYAGKLKELKDGLRALRQLNTVCEKCEGKGKYLRSRACAEDYRPDPNDPSDYKTCPECNGSGLSK